MYKLGKVYGKQSYDAWHEGMVKDLSNTTVSPDEACAAVWEVRSFRKLVEAVAFLTSMNKRHTLLYRGQRRDVDPLPGLFRSSWRCFGSDETFEIPDSLRPKYWEALQEVGEQVYSICSRVPSGLPRKQGLREVREIQWAIIQHYELWPTPLLDLTSSLRVAATFALGLQRDKVPTTRVGYLYVAGLPHSTGSINYDIDQNLVLARLQSACPPIAFRPHFQDGFLLGRFPMYTIADAAGKSSLLRRVVAKFKLVDAGKFWSKTFPRIPTLALMPRKDPLLETFISEFGRTGHRSVRRRALQIRRELLLKGACGLTTC